MGGRVQYGRFIAMRAHFFESRDPTCTSKDLMATYHRVTFLNELVTNDERLERHDFVREDRLNSDPVPDWYRSLIIPRVDDAL